MSTQDLPREPVEALYRAHQPWLLGWLRRRLGDAFLAADLSQDTFVRVLNKDGLPTLREPRAFLATIANGLVLNLHRRQALERAYSEALALLPQACEPSPETRAVFIETLVEIDERLGTLPAPVREAFLLAQLDGLRQAEIAVRLQLSVPTVKRHIARALERCCFGD